MRRWWKVLVLVVLLAPLSVAWTDQAVRPPIRLPEVVIVGLPVAEPTEAKEPVRLPAVGPLREIPAEVKEPVDLASLQAESRTVPVAPAPGCTYRSRVTASVAKVFIGDEAQYKLGLYRIQHGDTFPAIEAFGELIAQYPASSWRTAARYWVGEAYMNAGDEGRALESFEAALKEPPGQHLADYNLYADAWILVRRSRHAEALERLTKLVAGYQASPVMPAALELKSIAHWQLGQFEAAAEASRQLAEQFPEDKRAPDARFWFAEGSYRAGQYLPAWEGYQAFLQRHPGHPRVAEAQYGLGWAGLALKAGDQATEAFMSFERQYPQSRLLPSARYGEVRSALVAGKPDVARQRLAVLRQSNPGRWATVALAAVADEAFKSGRHQEALDDYRALALEDAGGPFELTGILKGAEAAMAMKRYDVALNLYDDALRRKLDDEVYQTVLLKRGVALYSVGRYREAAANFGEAADFGLGTKVESEARWLQAESFYQARDLDEARQVYRSIDPAGPRGAEALFGQAWVEAEAGRPKEAKALLDAIALERPDHPLAAQARLKAASLAAEAKEFQEAAERLQALIVAYPESAEAAQASWRLGQVLARSGDYGAAANAYASFLSKYPDNELADDAQFELSMSLYRLDDYARARMALKRLINEFPQSPHLAQAYLKLGDTFYNESYYAEAEQAYRQVVARYPKAAEAVEASYGVVLTYLRRDEWSSFLTAAERFLTSYPDHPLAVTLAFQVGDSAVSRNEQTQAVAAFERAVRLYPKSDLADDALFRIGQLKSAQGLTGDASAAFVRLLAEYPDSNLRPDAHFALAELYEKEGRWQDVVEQARAVIAQGAASGRLQTAALAAGRALIHLGKLGEAAESLKTAVNAGADKPLGRRAALELGDLEVGRNNPPQALEAYQLASQSSEPSVAVQGYYGAARMLEAEGKRQEAVATYLKVPYLYPDYKSLGAKAMLAAADGYEALGHRREALALYRKILADYPEQPQAREARASLKAAGEPVAKER